VQRPSLFYLTSVCPTNFVCLAPSVHQRPFITVQPRQRAIFFKPYVVLQLCSQCFVLLQKFGARDNTMSSNDESIIVQLEPRYQLRSNTQSFESISLSSRSSWWYHQTFTMPLSSSTIPTRNFNSGYTTSTVHQSPFGGVNQWGTTIATPTFTPSPYILL
jgi:hypothetical protein